jgi:hypothetical protein
MIDNIIGTLIDIYYPILNIGGIYALFYNF